MAPPTVWSARLSVSHRRAALDVGLGDEARIPPMVSFLLAALDQDLSKQITSIAAHLPELSNEPGESQTLQINVQYSTHSYFSVLAA